MTTLVVGLGNPGDKYLLNRHNVGYLVLDNIVKRFDLRLIKKKVV
jgi:PTH1 family peptidyl-tRNA hydrolase